MEQKRCPYPRLGAGAFTPWSPFVMLRLLRSAKAQESNQADSVRRGSRCDRKHSRTEEESGMNKCN